MQKPLVALRTGQDYGQLLQPESHHPNLQRFTTDTLQKERWKPFLPMPVQIPTPPPRKRKKHLATRGPPNLILPIRKITPTFPVAKEMSRTPCWAVTGDRRVYHGKGNSRTPAGRGVGGDKLLHQTETWHSHPLYNLTIYNLTTPSN